ncbi:unnamed protein product [Ceutorhynchus assimilis]|uniref:TGF-beta family profile domain-containing protein n=1 Tax=Ceutorhynchus assimilis TaxID=467358 RepID=A0A9N9QIE8_9CUCU|nr:unnamed protein product [Ceutorhynchus assimilis]
MGYNFGANRAAWTFFVIVYTTSVSAAAGQDNLLSDLGLDVLDRAKINISLQEYTSVLSTFLRTKDDSFEEVPELRVYRLDNLPKQGPTRKPLKMLFSVPASTDKIESATLRLLLPPQHNDPRVINIAVNQILGTRRKRFIKEEIFYLSNNLTKWCEVDVTDAVLSWTRGQKNLGLELFCRNCHNNLNPSISAITALVHSSSRRKRSIGVSKGRTDCSLRHQKGKGKRKCCRHEMHVTFTKLGFKQMGDILEPKMYEAGYCQGMCPPNYNLATNHSRIQGLMHQLNKREARNFKNKTMVVPKTCCAPSKLGDLDILIVDSQQPDKLKVEKWQNMRVLECACS